MSISSPALATAPARLDPLPHPVTFVFQDFHGRFSDVLANPDDPPAVDAIHDRFGSAPAPNWVLQTYLRLRERGLDVSLSGRLVPGRINVIMILDVGPRSLAYRSYVVGCRADGPRAWACDHAVVQNPTNVHDPETEHLIQHWPQPSLIPRDPGRGDALTHLCYKGGRCNLWEGFLSPEFRERLAAIGVEFTIDDESGGGPKWNDYRETDALLAVRDLTEADYFGKPASKLINAWLGRVPALLGPEPAFQALRRSELDFFEVRTLDEAVDAVRRLKDDPELYRKVVENGTRRAEEFDVDAISRRWRDVLAGPVAEGYERWLRGGVLRRSTRPVRFAGRILASRLEWKRYVHRRDHGFRPTSGRYT